jgi:hypothetical protein
LRELAAENVTMLGTCRRESRLACRSLVLLAVVFTLLNCFKPLHIDDTAYYYYADQIARHPLDAYGFAIYWWSWPEPANEVLAPAVLPYYWSLAISLFGDLPFLWKLWLFPFALLFTFSLHALLRRFARGLELPLAWLLVLSPAFLPSFNLMLDVPALALSLASLAVFCRAGDRDSLPLAALAGLLAGLAAQTKYTGLLTPALLLLSTCAFGKWRLWLVAAVLAVQVFVSWEFLLALLYGRSHFLLALGDGGGPLWDRIKAKARLLPNVLSISGGIGPAGLLLGLAALRLRLRWLVLAGTVMLSVYEVVACVGWEGDLHSSFIHLGAVNVSFEAMLFGLVGLCLLAVTGVVAWQLLRRRRRRAAMFLLLWLGLELLGYVMMTPFSAVRRLLGLTVAGTLLCGRLAAFTCRSPGRKKLIWGIAAVSAVLGLGFFGVDWLEAHAQKELAEGAVRLIREQDGDGTIWFVGHWGFQYYAERSGMRPVVAGDAPKEVQTNGRLIPLPPPSVLRRGDWLVFPDDQLAKQCLAFDRQALEPVVVLEVRDPVPLRTVVCYYAGRSALEHRAGPVRRSATVYRVTADMSPLLQTVPEGPCPAP